MRAVQRILAIFESFSAEKSSLSLHEISARIGLPKSTAFRIIQSLTKAGYLVRLDEQQYCLSFRFTRLAGLVGSTLSIREIARPFMLELAASSGETVSLQMARDDQRVCIDAVAIASGLRSVTQPGEHITLLAGASSKMLVAQLPPGQATRIVAQMARATKSTRASVLEELDAIRLRGFAISHGERLLGVTAIAAAIAGVGAQDCYCLSVAGPSVRMLDRVAPLVEMTLRAAAGISRQLGGVPLREAHDTHPVLQLAA